MGLWTCGLDPREVGRTAGFAGPGCSWVLVLPGGHTFPTSSQCPENQKGPRGGSRGEWRAGSCCADTKPGHGAVPPPCREHPFQPAGAAQRSTATCICPQSDRVSALSPCFLNTNLWKISQIIKSWKFHSPQF